jgi:hypothetical protein
MAVYPTFQGRRFNQQGGIPNGNQEEGQEGRQEEKEVEGSTGEALASPQFFA